MNTKQFFTEFHYKSAFRSHENPKTLAAAGWDLTNAFLSDIINMTTVEKQRFEKEIKNFIFDRSDYYLGYLEYFERTLLLFEDHGKYGSSGLRNDIYSWFMAGSYFNNTQEDHELLLQKRESDPEYKKNWKGLAEAVLEMQETPSPYILAYWENWLKERDASEELVLLRRSIGKSIHSV